MFVFQLFRAVPYSLYHQGYLRGGGAITEFPLCQWYKRGNIYREATYRVEKRKACASRHFRAFHIFIMLIFSLYTLGFYILYVLWFIISVTIFIYNHHKHLWAMVKMKKNFFCYGALPITALNMGYQMTTLRNITALEHRYMLTTIKVKLYLVFKV